MTCEHIKTIEAARPWHNLTCYTCEECGRGIGFSQGVWWYTEGGGEIFRTCTPSDETVPAPYQKEMWKEKPGCGKKECKLCYGEAK